MTEFLWILAIPLSGGLTCRANAGARPCDRRRHRVAIADLPAGLAGVRTCCRRAVSADGLRRGVAVLRAGQLSGPTRPASPTGSGRNGPARLLCLRHRVWVTAGPDHARNEANVRRPRTH